METVTTSERGRAASSHGDDTRQRLLGHIPLTERRLEVASLSTTVLEGGTGAPLMLLHGGRACGGAYWARVVSRLAGHYRLLVPDAPGLGESQPATRLDGAAFAEWFSALLRLTCDEKPALVAHSLLGSLAARYAVHEGELLRRLVIYGAPGIGSYRLPLGLVVAAIRFDLQPTQRNQERFERWAFLDSALTKRQDPAWFDALDAYTVARGRVRQVKRTMRQLIRIGTRQIPDAALRRIDIPTALLWGRHDRMVPLRLAEDASARLDWPLHVVDGVGHAPHLERPDAFVRTLHAALGEI